MADNPLLELKRAVTQALIDCSLTSVSQGVTDFFFVQVGANDGILDDFIGMHVKRSRWKGILFEPVPALFALLAQTYHDQPQVQLVQAACGDARQTLPFYRLKSLEAVPHDWMRGLSSFRRDVIREHFESDAQFDEHVEEVKIEMDTLDRWLAVHDVKRVDLLVVDTEGFDLRVMQGFDLARWKPSLVIVEHNHLDGADRRMLNGMFVTAGYERAVGCFDTLFYRADRFPKGLAEILRSFIWPALAAG